jgi:hypothetical protein
VGGAVPGRLRLQIRRTGSYTTRVVETPRGRRAQLVYRAAPDDEAGVQLFLDWDPTREVFTRLPEPPRGPVGFVVADFRDAAAADPRCMASMYLPQYQCSILDGLEATGPLLILGNRGNYAEVDYSRAGTVVFGGSGDDEIHAGGRVKAGAGADVIEARPWVRSQINGGGGDDTIKGSRREDVVVPGAGIDHVDSWFGRDLIRARDGEIDYLVCRARAAALIDAYDDYSPRCGRVKRRGIARAVPDGVAAERVEGEFTGALSVGVRCPPDAPRVCQGTLAVSRKGKVLATSPISVPRSRAPSVGPQLTTFPLGLKRLRAIEGKLRVTVRTNLPIGRQVTASGVFELFVYP